MLNILLDDVKKGDEYLFFAFNLNDIDEKLERIFVQHNFDRLEKKLKIRGMAPIEMKKSFKNSKINIKFVNFPLLTSFTIVNDKIMMLDWQEKPVGFLIESVSLTKKYTDFFNHIWDM